MNESMAEYVVSSYTPTLAALVSAHSKSPFIKHSLRMTAVIQPITPGYSFLPYTREELSKIEEVVPKQWLTSFGTQESPASVDRVLSHLDTSSILHFACHGIQDTSNPLESALRIGNEWLKASQIMEKSGLSHNTLGMVHGDQGLVFLSACETAMGDEKLPDEAMHLAGTLLFAGFPRVVATMW
jgi:CHAT domain-containing protein